MNLTAKLPFTLENVIFTGDFSVTDGTNSLSVGGNGYIVAMGVPLQLNSSVNKVNVTQGSLTLGSTGPEDAAPELKRSGSDVELTKGGMILAEGDARFRVAIVDGVLTATAL